MRFLKKKYHNGIKKLCTALGMLILLTGCYADTSSSAPLQQDVDAVAKIALTTADQETNCVEQNVIDLNQLEEICRITQPGCYLLSGELDGTIQIDAEDQLIHLVLNGVVVESSQGPALEVVSAGKIFITLQDGTENFLLDAADYPINADADACLFSSCDMTINGSGALNVYGYYKDAIHSKDVLKVLDGKLFVQSKRNGLRGNDGVVIRNASLNVQSEKNGIQSTKVGQNAKGNIEIYDSICSVIGGEYAISCLADLYVADSDVYAMGILGDIEVNGTKAIEEGNLQNE